MNESEKKHGTLPVVTAKTQEKSVTVIKGKGPRQIKSSYTFDNVFTAFSTQEEVFEATVKPMISDVMRGFESTVFAYGQTGTGKTHTMEGSLSSPELYGVIPRSAQAIFEHLKQPQYKDQVVTCSYLEIYNEELRDLLDDGTAKMNDKQGKLEIMEGKNGTFCRNLTEREVKSAEDVLNLMQKAQQQRIVGETKMNKSSSRSHCLFTIQVHGKITLLNGDGDMEFFGKLHMVDLAGSECAKSAGNEKGAPNEVARERERMNINRSLLTLGRVISILKERSENKNTNARIPYRDSKLTRILQESLGGRCKTVIVATLSPSITAIEESISTLNYAQSANGIMNKPVSSSLISFGVGENGFSNERPKEGSSVESWQEMEMRLQYMQAQVEEAQAALARKHLQQQELQERADKSEADLLESQQKLFNANLEINSLRDAVAEETQKRKESEEELFRTQEELKKTSLILKATQATEVALTTEARALIGTLETLIADRNEMHSLVVAQRDMESQRRKATQRFQQSALDVLSNIESAFAGLRSNIDVHQSNVIDSATLTHKLGRQSISEFEELLAEVARNVQSVTNSLKSQLTGEVSIHSIVEADTRAVLDGLACANSTFSAGEKDLQLSQEAKRMRLAECATTLVERSSSIESASTRTLQSFEENIEKSRNSISTMVENVKKSLSKLSNAKEELTSIMGNEIKRWRDQSLDCAVKLHDNASCNFDFFGKSVDEFQREMCHYDDVSKSLENQRSFLNEYGSAHVKSVDEQTRNLSAHREKLLKYHDVQVTLRKEVMESIMTGVQNLLSNEIEKLAVAQAQHFRALDKDGLDLAASNEKVVLSAKQVMSNIQSTNYRLSEKATLLRSNDARASEAMATTMKVLEEVVASSKSHQQLTNDFSSKSLVLITDIKQLDTDSMEISEKIAQEGKVCMTSLHDGVLNPTREGLKAITTSSVDALSYVASDVIANECREIEKASRNREVVAGELTDKLQRTVAKISGLTDEVLAKALSQSEAAGKLCSSVSSAQDIHKTKTVPYYNAELDAGKDKIASSAMAMADSSSRRISEGESKGNILKQDIDNFATKDMLCLDPVAPAPTLKECKFSDQLSSTPAESDILVGHDFLLSSPECGESSLPSMVACTADSPDDDMSQEEDNRSRKSSTSQTSILSPASRKSSCPSPGLKQRDLNVHQTESTLVHKLHKHNRPHIGSSMNRKNKAPSGVAPSAARKKMKR